MLQVKKQLREVISRVPERELEEYIQFNYKIKDINERHGGVIRSIHPGNTHYYDGLMGTINNNIKIAEEVLYIHKSTLSGNAES